MKYKCKYYIEPSFKADGYKHFKHEKDHAIVAINEHTPDKNNRIEVYNVIDGHAMADVKYLKECKEITKEEYKEITKGWFTHNDYL